MYQAVLGTATATRGHNLKRHGRGPRGDQLIVVRGAESRVSLGSFTWMRGSSAASASSATSILRLAQAAFNAGATSRATCQLMIAEPRDHIRGLLCCLFFLSLSLLRYGLESSSRERLDADVYISRGPPSRALRTRPRLAFTSAQYSPHDGHDGNL